MAGNHVDAADLIAQLPEKLRKRVEFLPAYVSSEIDEAERSVGVDRAQLSHDARQAITMAATAWVLIQILLDTGVAEARAVRCVRRAGSTAFVIGTRRFSQADANRTSAHDLARRLDGVMQRSCGEGWRASAGAASLRAFVRRMRDDAAQR
jgi:hypothetical protein